MGIRERSESRDGYAVRVLAVHTSEGVDKPVVDDAAALRDATWWEGSSHAIADNDPGSLLTPAEGCVPYDRASWTLRSGNRWSENIELIAQASWTRAQWLARPKLLDRCAYWLAVRSKVDRGGGRRIPLVKITAAQYRAGAWGVIGHHDHTVGYSDGTHWDPGPDYPWDVVLAKANAYRNGTAGGFLMALSDGQQQQVYDWLGTLVTRTEPVERYAADGQTKVHYSLRQEIADTKTLVSVLAGKPVVDPAAVAEALRPMLLDAVQAGKSASSAATADEIVDELVARLGNSA